MNLRTALLFLALSATAAAAAATEDPGDRPPEYAPLQGFVGTWTTLGREKAFREVCEWYPGGFHVVCHSRSERPDGSTGHGMSILSYVPGTGYVYSGIGSKGRYETFSGGRWVDGTFVFDSAAVEEGVTVNNRITIGPFTEAGFLFVVTSSRDGVAWEEVGRTNYLRLE